jgi:surfactin synthase thioesterase subunit
LLRSLTPVAVGSPQEVTDDDIYAALNRLNSSEDVMNVARASSTSRSLMRRDLWLNGRTDSSRLHLPANIPLLVFGGESDSLETFDKNGIARVKPFRSVETSLIPGGHLFIDTESGRKSVVQTILSWMADRSSNCDPVALRGSQ